MLAVLGLTFALVHIELVGWYVDLPWKRLLWAAMTLAVVCLLLYVRFVVPLRLLRLPWVVDEVVGERGRPWTLVLRPAGHPGMKFLPGQFAWLRIGRSPFAIEDHPFSFSSSAEDGERIAMTIKEAGDFTAGVGALTAGTPAYVDGPHGAFSIDRYEGKGCVFVAGGVGITPVMSMLRTLADRGDARPQLLVFGASRWEDVTFREELEALRARLDLRIVYVLSEGAGRRRGARGRISGELLADHLPDDRAAYLTSSAASGDDGRGGAVAPARRVPWPSIYTERFDLV